MKSLLITGGAGFIGANFVRHLLAHEPETRVVNLDALTYAGSLENLRDLPDPGRHTFVRGDITDRSLVDSLFRDHAIEAVVHFAAESHVDRSILGPGQFVQTNIVGTFTLLEAARAAWLGLEVRGQRPEVRGQHRFHHVSTDEVFGSLGPADPAFTERTPYDPSSPYSASKAASDHLVRAYARTYGLPVTITNCSNNYGPYQFPEKLLPLMILNALEGKPLPVYGDGMQVRDWLYVEDHCAAILAVLRNGRPGETYNVGGDNQPPNIEIVRQICDLVAELDSSAAPTQVSGFIPPPSSPRPHPSAAPTQVSGFIPPPSSLPPHPSSLITHVTDRPGHDRRYAMDIAKIKRELGWQPRESLATGLRRTVQWYLEHPAWVAAIRGRGGYGEWMERNYAGRGRGQTG